MVIRRKEEITELDNDNEIHFYEPVETKENLEKAAAEAKTAYENNPTLPNKLDSLYAEAERQFAAGEREEAVKFLKDEVSVIHEMYDEPATLIKWMDTLSLLAEMLLRLKRPEEAMKYSDRVFELAENHFQDTAEFIYAEELYAMNCALLGERETAKDLYTDALSRLKGELGFMEHVKENIENSLKSLE